ncbi:MAG TPA: putative metal-binding motif-containing protein [Kofleriaceae bacterium]|nr:putative metal-binding motif-containing protein [Kofleriaceae bacterium]
MKGFAGLAACAIAAAVAGCGPDGGIVLEIHRAPGSDTEIYRLEVRVGVGHDTGGTRAIDPSWWLAASVADGQGSVALPDGLGTSTFRYKLDASDALSKDQDLVVAVIGYGADPSSPPILFGHTTNDGVRFADGVVREVDLPLATFSASEAGVGKAGCVWWNDIGNASARTHQHAIVPDADSDCDGYAEGHDEMGACQLDCNDLDPSISPEASEVCNDGIDQNCCAFDLDGMADPDGDGVNACSPTPDCVDMPRGTVVAIDIFGRPVKSEDIHPGAAEICDGIDNDCQHGCDDDPGLDPDGDGYLNCVSPEAIKGVHRKEDGHCVPAPLDCADSGMVHGVPASEIHPDAADDQCDQVDEDCSGVCDEAKVAAGDGDNDGFPACGTTGGWIGEQPTCRIGRQADCDDTSALDVPGGLERCDGLDFNCDGVLFDEPLPCFRTDNQQHCVIGSRTCTDGTGSPMPIGPCLADPNAPPVILPESFCTPNCSPDDPSTCTGTEPSTCDVDFRQGGPAPVLGPCTPADIPLDSDPQPTCRWLLVGGSSQGDWKVTLQRGAQTANSFETCGGDPVTLHVLGASPDAADRSVLIIDQTRMQVVRLRRHDVNVCGVPSVSCHG